MVLVAASMVLAFRTATAGGSVSGLSVPEGRVVALAGLATVLLIQMKLRPAWMGAGFTLAVLGRQAISYQGSNTLGSGLGLWLGILFAACALVLLVQGMFASMGGEPPPKAGN